MTGAGILPNILRRIAEKKPMAIVSGWEGAQTTDIPAYWISEISPIENRGVLDGESVAFATEEPKLLLGALAFENLWPIMRMNECNKIYLYSL